MLSVSFLPAVALASTIVLPPAPTQNLGVPPASADNELFSAAPSHFGNIAGNNRYFNSYTVDLSAGDAYSLAISNWEFDTFFLITDDAGNILVDSHSANSVADTFELRLIAPFSGIYHVIISSETGTCTGTYTLTVSPILDFGQISGTVQSDAPTPLSDILVTAYREVTIGSETQWVPEVSTITDASGIYVLSPLFPGSYRISYRDLNSLYASLYYYQEQIFEDATTVALTPNEHRTLNATTLTLGATVTGEVTDENDLPLENIIVSAYITYEGSSFALISTETEADGTYMLTGLEADTYYIKFACPDGMYLTQFYDDVSTINAASELNLAIGTLTEDIDAKLQPASVITGTVTDSTASSVEDIVVSLLRLRPGRITPVTEDCFEIVTQTLTEDDGTYFFGALEAGTYYLHFSDPEGIFLDLYYIDGLVPARAGPVTLLPAQHSHNHNVVLIRATSLSGTVTDNNLSVLPGINVRLFCLEDAPNPITSEFLEYPTHETYTDDWGDYSFDHILPGNYILKFSDPAGIFVTRYHLNQDSPDTANTITVIPGVHLTNVNATLHPASRITGTLVDEASGLLLSAANVFLFTDTGDLTPAHATVTASNGSFLFAGLSAGTYYLGFAPEGYAIPASLQFFDGALSPDDAVPITISDTDLLDLDQILWRKLPTFTLTLDAQNSSDPETIEVVFNTALTELPTPTFFGHVFTGWFTHPTAGSLVNAPLAIDEDTTLYGRWTRAEFTLAFDSRGGNTILPRTRTFGDRFGTLPVPTRAGHDFLGWSTTPTGGTFVNTNTLVTQNQTLFAQWRIRRHTVTFNTHGGTAVANRTVTWGQTVGTLPTPRRAHHTFMGWFTAASGGTRVQTNRTITANTTLHARWQRQTVTLRFDTQGGRAISAQSRGAGTRLTNLPRPVRTNRVFHRWTLDRAGRRPVTSQTVITSNTTLFAQWRSNDARLRGISRSAGTINRSFSPNVLNYQVSLRANTQTVRIAPVTRCSRATVAMRVSNQNFRNTRSLSVSVPRGQTRVVQIRVTSEDRRHTHTYRVTITRAAR